MDYKVLYRKYRPSNFDELVGQEHIKQILKNSIINNKIAHAYIFTGPRGTGKTSTAKIFAKTLNCLEPTNGISCGKCANCLEFSTSPDIIEMDAASNNGVENIRDIIENISVVPTMGKYKIYIIDEVHMLSTQAWNAFLKTLEEPPANVIFILATTDIQKVPITVLSRCQRFDFQRIDRKLISDNLSMICLKENVKCTQEALDEIAYISDGCMRDALSILDQLSKVTDEIDIDTIKNNYGTVSNEDIDELYSTIIHNDIDNLLELLNKIKQSGVDIKIFINKILNNFIDKAVTMKKRNVSNNAFKQIRKIIENVSALLNKLNSNSNGYLLLELELISFINDDENQISSRDISQIISREIISSTDKVVNIENLVQESKQIYKICDDFINIRINNAFVNASKDSKKVFSEIWDKFFKNQDEQNKKEFKTLYKSSIPQVVSDNYVVFVTNSESIKTVGNAKLYELENVFNSNNKTKYKMIFINKDDWNRTLASFSKEKKYELQDETEYLLQNASSIALAENIFGMDNIKVE